MTLKLFPSSQWVSKFDSIGVSGTEERDKIKHIFPKDEVKTWSHICLNIEAILREYPISSIAASFHILNTCTRSNTYESSHIFACNHNPYCQNKGRKSLPVSYLRRVSKWEIWRDKLSLKHCRLLQTTSTNKGCYQLECKFWIQIKTCCSAAKYWTVSKLYEATYLVNGRPGFDGTRVLFWWYF